MTGSSKQAANNEDEILKQILGTDGKESHRSGLSSRRDSGSDIQRGSSSGSSSRTQDGSDQGGLVDVLDSQSVDNHNSVLNEMSSASPEGLRQQALEEKKKHKVLKGEGKPEEALRAFKRGKELERQADALEILIRKNRRKVASVGPKDEIQINDGSKESGRRNRSASKASNEKDDLTAELRELGWSDRDLQGSDKSASNMSLEGELSTLLRDVSHQTNKDINTPAVDKTPVIAIKRKALMLKREGKLAEAKEELKRAKVLEKQLEEQELLAEAGDSDDELSAIIRSMDDDEQDGLLSQYEQTSDLDFGHLAGSADDHGLDGNLEVTEEDMEDPEMAAALRALGWTEDANVAENRVTERAPLDRDALSKEILSLKREALNNKRAGNVAEAMSLLKKAKLLEKDLESTHSPMDDSFAPNLNINSAKSLETRTLGDANVDFTGLNPKVEPKNKLKIQRELLAIKKKALALRREGRVDEAEEELNKGKALERQLEQMESAAKVKATGSKENPIVSKNVPIEEGEEDVTDQDMNDPAYLETLRSLGWNDEDSGLGSQSSKPSFVSNNIPLESSSTPAISVVTVRAPRRSKAEIQRELLSLKRKALALRRQGKGDEAEEVLNMAKVLEAEMEDLDAPKRVQVESNQPKSHLIESSGEGAPEGGDEGDVTESDMNDPVLLSQLKNVGWKGEDNEPKTMSEKPTKVAAGSSLHYMDPSVTESSMTVSVTSSRSKGEIQRELLGLKRKALALRRKGETEEAEELLNKAKALEAQMEALDAPNHQLDAPKDKKPEVGINTGAASVGVFSNEKAVESSQVNTVDHLLVRDVGPSGETGLEANLGPSIAKPAAQLDPLSSLSEGLQSQEEVKAGNSELLVHKLENPQVQQVKSVVPASTSEKQTSLRQEILALKRKAVALKREGKLTEAREELRQAKLLEKNLEDDNAQTQTSPPEVPKTAAQVPSTRHKQQDAPDLAHKPLSSRDRFKLQQESLSHKRQALKLRREGRMDEAEAEFELAKNLEAQLEEHDSKSSVNDTEPGDGVVVEDLLDPQLLSALQAIGIDDASISSQSREKVEAVKPTPKKVQNSNDERHQLEERIKAEKVKAVSLKRSGKQAEAMDALRRAKLYEKKLNSLA